MLINNKKKLRPSDRIRTPNSDPGLLVVGTHDLNSFQSALTQEFQLDREKIFQYRRIACSTYVDSAIDDIVNESIGPTQDGKQIKLDLTHIELSDDIKSKIMGEFEKVCTLCTSERTLTQDFRKWYIDGKATWMPIPHDNTKEGLREVRKLDSRFISKITKITYNASYGLEQNLNSFVTQEAFVFFPPTEQDYKSNYVWAKQYFNAGTETIELDPKMVVHQDSGIYNEYGDSISYLDRAVKPLNQLSKQEDSLVIYRLVKAPERRAWYVDVSGIPKPQAEAYIKSLIEKQRTRIGYNTATGETTSSTDVRSMLDDLYLPVRADGRGTKVETLPGGQNLGEIDDVIYFRRKLYTSLKVPVSRVESEGSFSLGRSAEITRDEVKFYNFTQSLCKLHSNMFKEVLGIQLILKNIMTLTEWHSFKDKIFITYSGNSFFAELKELDIMTERLNVADRLREYVDTGYINPDQITKILQIENPNSDSIKKPKPKTTDFDDDGDGEYNKNSDDSSDAGDDKSADDDFE